MAIRKTWQLVCVLTGALVLSGCDEANLPAFMQKRNADGDSAIAQSGTTKLIERDVEAPEVFQMSEAGLWDGRPSLGGVWIAHPDVGDPERVIIRNQSNGKFVIGALFRRERDVPGPRFQVSSDAADSLGLLAGAPAELNVTALRREEVPEQPTETPTTDLTAAEGIEAEPLDPIAAAAAALDAAEGVAPAATAAPVAAAPAAATAPKPASSLSKPFIQIGIFSVEANAKRTADRMRKSGMVPTIKQGTTSGKAFWRVVVGPATSSGERAALLKKVKGLGFADAYFVTN